MNSYTILSFSFFLFFFFIKAATPPPQPSSSCCSTQFQCGSLKGIGYPFWGNSRSSSCGKPEFELNCDQNNITQIQIMSNTYRVLSVLPQNQTIRIARMDLWENICPSSPKDTSLILNYSISSTRIMSLLYGCPVSNVTYPNLFTCSDFNQTTDAYLLNNSMSSNQRTTFQNACRVEIQVPILQSAFDGLMSGEVAIWDVFREGFDVLYDAENSVCNSCKSSSGECGYDSGTNKTVCTHTNYVCTVAAPGPPKNRPIPTSPPGGGEPVSSPFTSEGGEPVSSPSPSGGGEPMSSPSPSGGNVKVIVGVVASVGGTLVIAAVGIIIFCRLRKKKTKNPENLEAFLKTHGGLALRRYKYSDVKKITDSFQDKLGQGGFGSVYKGKLLDGRMVAVKVLNETKGNGNEFINEVASISRTSHVNIVALLGFCVEGSKRALIYEYVPNGSLEKFIYVENPLEADSHLGWETLYKIAIGIAHGLEYLHRGCYIRILHFDIKPHNILLDEEFNPKISDFGLAKLCVGKNSMVSMTGARGTAGYIAPEVVSRNFGGVSHKADVYSYGMMLLEIVGGRKNLNVRVTNLSEIYFPQWIYRRLDLNEDLGLYGVTTVEEEEIARKMILVGLWCIQMDPSDRPAMSKVLEMLEGSLQALQIPPKPFVSTPAREEAHSSTTSIS